MSELSVKSFVIYHSTVGTVFRKLVTKSEELLYIGDLALASETLKGQKGETRILKRSIGVKMIESKCLGSKQAQ